MTQIDYNEIVQQNNDTQNVARPGKGKVLIQCLDVSGSMAGRPMEALRTGALKVGETILNMEKDKRPFEQFITMAYNHKVDSHQAGDMSQFSNYVNSLKARCQTNFSEVFKEILRVARYPDIDELTVIFFTDGHDTFNSEQKVESDRKEMEQFFKAHPNIVSRFLTIGFSKDHDAPFMNKIAQSGSHMGNFSYIDTSDPSYPILVTDTLAESLQIAIEVGSSLKLEISNNQFQFTDSLETECNYIYKEPNSESTGGDPEAELVIDHQCLCVQTLIPTKVIDNGVNVKIKFGSQVIPLSIQHEKVEEPPQDIILKARLRLANKQIFDICQDVQAQNEIDRANCYERVKELDRLTNEYSQACYKIKDRKIKCELMESFVEIKQKVSTVMRVLSAASKTNFDNSTIAQLNDVAYKAIRKKGVQKKLDERTIKNEKLFTANEQMLKRDVKNFDLKQIRVDQHHVIQDIGSCPITQLDVVEAVESLDCFCLCLDISRSEACISDPSKLRINRIIPQFMTCDAFLDSSIFELKKNEDAHGGFDLKQQGALALGVAREQVSGVLPLYLFKEHWEVARRKLQPLFGFLCCLDPMGYAASQLYALPFLVLLKAIEDVAEHDSESTRRVLKVVLATCCNLVSKHENLKKQIIEQSNAFVKFPASRTADAVSSVQVLVAQLFSLQELPEQDRSLKVADPQADPTDSMFCGDYANLQRFSIEELLRRMVPKTSQIPLTKQDQLALLYPDHDQVIQKFRAQKRGAMAANKKQAIASGLMASYLPLAQELRLKAGELAIESELSRSSEESQQAADGSSAAVSKTLDIQAIVDQEADRLPWLNFIESEEHEIGKGLLQRCAYFSESKQGFIRALNWLQGQKEAACVTDIMQLLAGGDKEIMFAIHVQNRLHCKNSLRTEAISSGTYKQITTKEDARQFLKNLLTSNLTLDLMAVETQLRDEAAALQQNQSTAMIVGAPDVFLSASVLLQQRFCQGEGDTTAFFNFVLSRDPNTIADLPRKLRIVFTGEFMGEKIFNDQRVQQFNIKKQTCYRLWMHCSRKNQVVALHEWIEMAPYMESTFVFWDRLIDQQGKISFNLNEYADDLTKRNEQKEQLRKRKMAKAAQKGKL